MRKNMKLAAVTAAMTMLMSMTAFAGQWKSDANGWWWQNDDGSYPVNTWQWIDGNSDGTAESYYFDGQGYCLLNTTTPDGYVVNPVGAWIVDGVVQTRPVGDADISEPETGEGNPAIREDLLTTDRYMASYGVYDRSNVRINRGELWSRAILYNPNSYCDFALDGKFTNLTFTAAPEKGFEDDVEGIIEVYGDDDQLLYQSEPIYYDTHAFTDSVDISGHQNLKIVWGITDEGSSFSWDVKNIYMKNAYIQ